MKCRYCDKDIPDNSNFCLYCGKQNNKDEIKDYEEDIIASHTWEEPQKNNWVNNSLIIGGVALFFSFLLGNLFGLIGIVLGVVAIIYGLKGVKTGVVKKAVLGATFGFLAVLFGVIFVVKYGIQMQTVNNLGKKYEEKFNLNLPDKRPDEYILNENLVPRFSFHLNEFHYYLNSSELDHLYESQSWQNLPLDNQLSSRFSELKIKAEEGFYLYYDNKSQSFVIPSLNKDYDLVIIIIDTKAAKLSIYEIWLIDGENG